MKFQPTGFALVLIFILLFLFAYWVHTIFSSLSNKKEKYISLLRSTFITLLAILVCLRPMRPTYTSDALLKNVDVLFVLDNTISMYATENKQIRMQRVAKDCQYIMHQLSGSNFAMIRFDNTSQILSPFTQDERNITDILSVITYPDTYYASGSSLNTPYKDMESLLISSHKKENRMTVVFFLSDGEITDDSKLMSYQELARYIDHGAVLGYGTTKGEKMEIQEGLFSYPLIDPTTNQEALTKIDLENLNAIAKDLGIGFYHMEKSSQLDSLLNQIQKDTSSYIGTTNAVDYEDIYYYFLYPLFILLLYELYYFKRKGKIV